MRGSARRRATLRPIALYRKIGEAKGTACRFFGKWPLRNGPLRFWFNRRMLYNIRLVDTNNTFAHVSRQTGSIWTDSQEKIVWCWMRACCRLHQSCWLILWTGVRRRALFLNTCTVCAHHQMPKRIEQEFQMIYLGLWKLEYCSQNETGEANKIPQSDLLALKSQMKLKLFSKLWFKFFIDTAWNSIEVLHQSAHGVEYWLLALIFLHLY